MTKILYTRRDIEEMVHNGTLTLTMRDDIALTHKAYEKARRLGMELIQQKTDTPPAAHIHPHIFSGNKIKSNDTPPRQRPPIVERLAENLNILRFNDSSNEDELRAAIVEAGKIAYQSGLIVSNDGNISVRMPNGHILITPSGLCKGRIKPDDLLVVNLDGKLVKPAVDPLLKPTSEQPMHLEAYRQRPDIRAVFHTHLIFANALVISKGKVRMDVIPEAAVAFGEIPITDFAMPSSRQNAEVIHDLIVNHDVLLIRNHGSIAVGKNLDEALIQLERLEHVSKTLTYAELLGNINPMPPEMLAAIAETREYTSQKE